MGTAQKWHRFKELPDDLQDRLTTLPALLAGEGVLLAYLFGSTAKEGSGQDVDLALLMPEERRPYELQEAINQHLDTVIHELRRYETITAGDLQADLSQRWVIERGLIAAATLILDVADISSSKRTRFIQLHTKKA